MKVVNLHRIQSKTGRELWAFSLVLEGFIVNGFLFNAVTNSLIPPMTTYHSGKFRRVVNSFGAQWLRLRKLVQQTITTHLDNIASHDHTIAMELENANQEG